MFIHKLPHCAKIISNTYESDVSDEGRRYFKYGDEISFADEREEKDNLDTYVKKAVERATSWGMNQALTATTQGETDTSKIYIDILRRIATPANRNKPAKRFVLENLLDKAQSLKNRSISFCNFGLVNKPFELEDIVNILESASSQKKTLIKQVLSPYISSYEARLNALDELRIVLDTFSSIFSKFYTYKTLTIDVRNGINIKIDYNSARISPELLSSGEKQLLLLFCNVLLARSRPSVFLIDEPELSLNIKWQRELISSLMACVRGCNVQFILATHSIEMINLHKKSAIKLINAV